MFCHLCREAKHHNTMSIGTGNFRTSTLSRHVSVSEHQTLVSAPRERKNLEKAVAVVATREEKAVTVAMKAAFWLCTENLPMAKFPSLLKFPVSEAVKVKRIWERDIVK